MIEHAEAIARMEQAFNLIVNYEFAWNQDHWRVATPDTACGTALCFAGWATSASNYAPLVEKPMELAKKFGGWAEMQEKIDDALWGFIVIPKDDPLSANSATTVSYAIENYTYGKGAEVMHERFKGREDDKVMEIEKLANLLLDVRTDESYEGILNSMVFTGGNSLDTIRGYIDAARERASLEPRDFAEEPVPVITDEWVPEETIPDQVERVRRFNERASGPNREILSDREALIAAEWDAQSD